MIRALTVHHMPIVLTFGDSNGWGRIPGTSERFPESTRWPVAASSRAAHGWRTINESLPGRTLSSDDPDRAGKNGAQYLLPCLFTWTPVDALVIALGTNDCKAKLGLSPDTIAEHLGILLRTRDLFASWPDGCAPRTLVIAPPPLSRLTEYGRKKGFDEEALEKSSRLSSPLQAMAEEFGCDFIDAGKLVHASPIDGIHLDEEAHHRLSQAVAEWLS